MLRAAYIDYLVHSYHLLDGSLFIWQRVTGSKAAKALAIEKLWMRYQRHELDFATRLVMLLARHKIWFKNPEQAYVIANLIQDSGMPVFDYLLGKKLDLDPPTAVSTLQFLSSLLDYTAYLNRPRDPNLSDKLDVGARLTYLFSCILNLPGKDEFFRYTTLQKFMAETNALALGVNVLDLGLSGMKYWLGDDHPTFHFSNVYYHGAKAVTQSLGRSRAMTATAIFQLGSHPFTLSTGLFALSSGSRAFIKLSSTTMVKTIATKAASNIVWCSAKATAETMMTKIGGSFVWMGSRQLAQKFLGGMSTSLTWMTSRALAKKTAEMTGVKILSAAIPSPLSAALWIWLGYDVYSLGKEIYQHSRLASAKEQIDIALKTENLAQYSEALELFEYYKDESGEFRYFYDYYCFIQDTLRKCISEETLQEMDSYLQSSASKILSPIHIQHLQGLLAVHNLTFGLTHKNHQRYTQGLTFLQEKQQESTESQCLYFYYKLQEEMTFTTVTQSTLDDVEVCLGQSIADDQKYWMSLLLAQHYLPCAIDAQDKRQFEKGLAYIRPYKDRSADDNFYYTYHHLNSEFLFQNLSKSSIEAMEAVISNTNTTEQQHSGSLLLGQCYMALAAEAQDKQQYEKGLAYLKPYQDRSANERFQYTYHRLHSELLFQNISESSIRDLEAYISSTEVTDEQKYRANLLLAQCHIPAAVEAQDRQPYEKGLAYLERYRDGSTNERFPYTYHRLHSELLFQNVSESSIQQMEEFIGSTNAAHLNDEQKRSGSLLLAQGYLSLAIEKKDESRYIAGLQLLNQHKAFSPELSFQYNFHQFQRTLLFNSVTEMTLQEMRSYFYSDEIQTISKEQMQSMLSLNFNVIESFKNEERQYHYGYQLQQYIMRLMETALPKEEVDYLSTQIHLHFLKDLSQAKQFLGQAFSHQIGIPRSYNIVPLGREVKKGNFYVGLNNNGIEYTVLNLLGEPQTNTITVAQMLLLANAKTAESVENLMPAILKRAAANGHTLDVKYLMAEK